MAPRVKMGVKVNGKTWAGDKEELRIAILERLDYFRQHKVSATAGVQGVEGRKVDDGAVRVIDKARWSEFGVTWEEAGMNPPADLKPTAWRPDLRYFITPRSFLRSTFAVKRKEWARYARVQLKAHLLGKVPMVNAMRLIATRMRDDIERTIVTMEAPPNAPSTLAAKKPRDKPLRDSGQLAASIRGQAEADGSKLGEAV